MIIDNITERCAVLTGIPSAEIKGTSRRPAVAHARFAVFVACRAAGKSLPQIGHAFRKDHTTIMHGVRRSKEIAARDQDHRDLVEALTVFAETVGQAVFQSRRKVAFVSGRSK